MTTMFGKRTIAIGLKLTGIFALPVLAQASEQTPAQAIQVQHATVASEWAKYRSDAFLLREGHFCGVLKVEQAGAATIKLMAMMERDQRRIGLSGDQRINVRRTISDWWEEDSKRERISSSKCNQYSAEQNAVLQRRAAEISNTVVEP